ncbi:MAG: ABC transporter ATP-binding protein/permease [Sphaerochaetaceae bacterium]|nr:ABC transporter ATP-binding protein/permease [Sphaerochaetaceae bacterium]
MLKLLFNSVRQYKKNALLTPLFMIGEVAMECIIPMIMASLIDHMYTENMSELLKLGGILLAMALFSLFCGVMSGRNAATASAGFAANLRHDVFYHIQDFSFQDVDKFSTSSLITRMTTDVTNVQMAFMMIIRTAVRSPLMLIFSVIMSFRINSQVATIFMGIIPVLGIALFLIGRTVFPVFKRIFKRYDAMNASIQENVNGIRVVKSFVREDFEIEKFKKTSENVKKDFTFAERILALNGPVMMFCGYGAILLISFIGARIIISSGGSDMSPGQLSSFMTYSMQILMSMMMLSMIVVMCSISLEGARRITEVLKTDSSLKSPENGKKDVRDGSIDFEKVSFRYRNQGGDDSLKNVDLHIKSGQTVGIIGSTGSSKSTLIQLIPRLYDVSEGSVKVGGTDVREYDLDSLRKQIAIVLQKNVLFSGTIRENIRWGKEDATDEEIELACRAAQAHEFIEQLPEGYETKIERGGTNVSGGQKQRLCIARALIAKPKVLILDDSTSAVDTRTDALLRKTLADYLPGTTKLIIAQRVSSVEEADTIIVMDEGRVVESGTHEELIARKGIYYEVWDSQTNAKEGA